MLAPTLKSHWSHGSSGYPLPTPLSLGPGPLIKVECTARCTFIPYSSYIVLFGVTALKLVVYYYNTITISKDIVKMWSNSVKL